MPIGQYSRNTKKSLKASITNRNYGGGNKKSGLINSTGGLPGISLFRAGSTQAQRDSRFCINQVGGVGSGVYQTRAPADGVSSSQCKTSAEVDAAEAAAQPVPFLAQRGNAYVFPNDVPLLGSQDSSNVISGNYIPNNAQIEEFINFVHDNGQGGDQPRNQFAAWIHVKNGADDIVMDNVARYLTKATLKDGMIKIISDMQVNGGSVTLQSIGENSQASTFTTRVPADGASHPTDAANAISGTKYHALTDTQSQMTNLNSGANSQIAGQAYRLSDETYVSGQEYVDLTNENNISMSAAQYSLVEDNEDKVYLPGLESNSNSNSFGFSASLTSSLVVIYGMVIDQLQEKYNAGDITLTNGGDLLVDNGAGAGPVNINLKNETDAGYVELQQITQPSDLNALEVFVNERQDNGSINVVTTPQKLPYEPGKTSQVAGISNVFDARTEFARSGSGVPSFVNVSHIYRSSNAGTLENAVIQDTLNFNHNLRDTATIILADDSSSTFQSFPKSVQINATAAIERLQGLQELQSENLNDQNSIVTSLNEVNTLMANNRAQMQSKAIQAAQLLQEYKLQEINYNNLRGEIQALPAAIGKFSDAVAATPFINIDFSADIQTESSFTIETGFTGFVAVGTLYPDNTDGVNSISVSEMSSFVLYPVFKSKVTDYFAAQGGNDINHNATGQVVSLELNFVVSTAVGIPIADLGASVMPESVNEITNGKIMWETYNQNMLELYRLFKLLNQNLATYDQMRRQLVVTFTDYMQTLRSIFINLGYENVDAMSQEELQSLAAFYLDSSIELEDGTSVREYIGSGGEGAAPAAPVGRTDVSTSGQQKNSSNLLSNLGFSLELLLSSIIVKSGTISDSIVALASAASVGTYSIWRDLKLVQDNVMTIGQFRKFYQVNEMDSGITIQNKTNVTDVVGINSLLTSVGVIAGQTTTQETEWNYLNEKGMFAFSYSNGDLTMNAPIEYLLEPFQKLISGKSINDADASVITDSSNLDYVEMLAQSHIATYGERNAYAASERPFREVLYQFGSMSATDGELVELNTNLDADTNQFIITTYPNSTPARSFITPVEQLKVIWDKGERGISFKSAIHDSNHRMAVLRGYGKADANFRGSAFGDDDDDFTTMDSADLIPGIHGLNWYLPERNPLADDEADPYGGSKVDPYGIKNNTNGGRGSRPDFFTNVILTIRSYVQDFLDVGKATSNTDLLTALPTADTGNITSLDNLIGYFVALYGPTDRIDDPANAFRAPLSVDSYMAGHGAKPTAGDMSIFYQMQQAFNVAIAKWVRDKITEQRVQIQNVQKLITTPQTYNNLISMPENTMAAYDYNVFNLHSENSDTTLQMAHLISFVLKIHYSERITALNQRINSFSGIIDTYSENSEMIDQEFRDAYLIMVKFYSQVVSQMQRQVGMLTSLLSTEMFYSPLKRGTAGNTSVQINYKDPHITTILFDPSQLMISLRFPTIVYQSSSRNILNAQTSGRATSITADRVAAGGSLKNASGDKWLVAAQNGIFEDATDGSTQWKEYTNKPKLSSTALDFISTKDGNATSSRRELAKLENTILSDFSPEATDATKTALHTSVENLRADARVIDPATRNPVTGADASTIVKDKSKLLQSVGTSQVQDYNLAGDTPKKSATKVAYSYPNNNNNIDGRNQIYIPSKQEATLTADPRYGVIASTALSELENELELIQKLELFSPVRSNGEIAQGVWTDQVGTGLAQIQTDLKAIFNSVQEKIGQQYVEDNDLISYFTSNLVTLKSASYDSFGDLVSQLYSHSEERGVVIPGMLSRVYSRSNMNNITDSEGCNIFVNSVISLITTRQQNLKTTIQGIDLSDLAEQYNNVLAFARKLINSDVEIMGSHLNVQSATNGLKQGQAYQTQSNSILPRFGSIKPYGPFSTNVYDDNNNPILNEDGDNVVEQVNQYALVGARFDTDAGLHANTISGSKSLEAINTIGVSPSRLSS